MRHFRSSGWLPLMTILLASGLAAQKPPSRAGVLAGVNFATLGGDDADNIGTRTTFFGGGFLELPLSRNFAIAPELLYTMKGGEETDEGVTSTFKVGYIEVPVLLKVAFPGSGDGQWKLRPHLYAGPAIAFKASCKFGVEEGGTALTFDCDEFQDEFEVKSSDFSVLFGGGIDIGNLMIGIRYDLGLTRIITDGGTDQDVKNRVLSIYAGYGFRLSK